MPDGSGKEKVRFSSDLFFQDVAVLLPQGFHALRHAGASALHGVGVGGNKVDQPFFEELIHEAPAQQGLLPQQRAGIDLHQGPIAAFDLLHLGDFRDGRVALHVGYDRDEAGAGDLLEGVGDMVPAVRGAELNEGVAGIHQGGNLALPQEPGRQIRIEDFRPPGQGQGKIFPANKGFRVPVMGLKVFLREGIDAGGPMGRADDSGDSIRGGFAEHLEHLLLGLRAVIYTPDHMTVDIGKH